MQFYEFKETQERVILIGVQTEVGDDVEASLDELEELAETAGAETVAKVIQNREAVHPGTYIGKGKIEEVASLLRALDANGVICDDELSPAQMKNLEDLLDTKVMDRTLVILDIFAAHASTSEGKIQVELAQLRYSMTRLAGFGRSMSRLGGGIGTRGPGEKKLEMDKRIIRTRISQLKRELAEVKKHREVARGQRMRNHVPVAAIVGYTNAGKSTLLNHLTHAGVLEEDKLFATLDPTTRQLELPGKQQILLTDTVGFIRKLPHHLIEAFKSTLEEAKYADFIIHVVDASNPQADKQMYIVYNTLRELDIRDKKIVTLFNKMDRPEADRELRDFRADHTARISARNDRDLETVKELLAQVLRENKTYMEHVFSYEDAGKIQVIRRQGELLSEEYTPEGIFVKAYIPAEVYDRLGI